jgi:DNA-binding GntR family transcriptional regulator
VPSGLVVRRSVRGSRIVNDIAIELSRSSPVPLYHQLSEQLVRAIESGAIERGSFLPNELELAESWRLSRPTVRRAIQELVDAGLVVRRRGVGTTVVNQRLRRPARLSSLLDAMRDQGATPSTRVLVHELRPAERDAALVLGIEEGSDLVHLERLRYSDERPLAILTNRMIVQAAGGITTEELERASLYELLRARGVRPRIVDQDIGAKIALPDEAKMLDVAVGAPLLAVRLVMQDDTGRTVELGTHVYNALRYSLQVTVTA